MTTAGLNWLQVILKLRESFPAYFEIKIKHFSYPAGLSKCLILFDILLIVIILQLLNSYFQKFIIFFLKEKRIVINTIPLQVKHEY